MGKACKFPVIRDHTHMGWVRKCLHVIQKRTKPNYTKCPFGVINFATHSTIQFIFSTIQFIFATIHKFHYTF